MIARVTKWVTSDGEDFMAGKKPMWVVVEKSIVKFRYDTVDNITPGDCWQLPSYLLPADGDEFRIVPENQLPEYVCVMLAKKALTDDA